MVWESSRIKSPEPFEASKSGKKFNEKLNGVNWIEVLNKNDTQDAFNAFYEIFYEVYNSHFVLKTRHKGRNKSKIDDYFTDELFKFRKKKLSLFRQSVVDPSKKNRY